MIYILSTKYSREKALLLVGVDLLLHFPRRDLVLFLVGQFISTQVVLLSLLVIPHFLVGIGKPSIGYDLFLIEFCSLFEAANCAFVLLQPEIGSSLIVIVNRMFGL